MLFLNIYLINSKINKEYIYIYNIYLFNPNLNLIFKKKIRHANLGG